MYLTKNVSGISRSFGTGNISEEGFEQLASVIKFLDYGNLSRNRVSLARG